MTPAQDDEFTNDRVGQRNQPGKNKQGMTNGLTKGMTNGMTNGLSDGLAGEECAWPTTADHEDPSTWGGLVYSPDVPEFSVLVFPIIVMVAVPLILRKHWRGDVFD